jgi:hypothetical protein
MSGRAGPSSSVEQGATASLTRTITEAGLQRLAQATGDSDLVHLDHEATVAPSSGAGWRTGCSRRTSPHPSLVLNYRGPAPSIGLRAFAFRGLSL